MPVIQESRHKRCPFKRNSKTCFVGPLVVQTENRRKRQMTLRRRGKTHIESKELHEKILYEVALQGRWPYVTGFNVFITNTYPRMLC